MGTLLQDGIDAAKSGRMEEALQLLRRSAEENPQNADVWVWLSAIIDDEEKQTEFLQKALEIDPENKPAQRGMAFLKRKKFIAPKPGETLSDHTRPIGVFKTGSEKTVAPMPVGPLAPVSEPAPEETPTESQADYDPDTENTIPPDATNPVELENPTTEPEIETEPEPDMIAVSESEPEYVDDPSQAAETQTPDETETLADAQNTPEESLEGQATQVSPVIADMDALVEEEASIEEEPELDQETQVAGEEDNLEEVTPVAEEKPKEHPLLAEAKRLKWQLLLFGLVLTAFIIIGILVGSTLKNLISPQKQNLSMNIEPIATQNGVFLLDGQEFQRLNILKAFPSENAGLVITELEAPQIILKDQMVSDVSKLKLLDASQQMIASKTKMLESTIPVLETNTSLTPGRYCVSYVLGSNESQAVFWCFVKN